MVEVLDKTYPSSWSYLHALLIASFIVTLLGIQQQAALDPDMLQNNNAENHGGPRLNGYDPPPTWNGENPEKEWRSMRRELTLWIEDSELRPAKQGVRLWRSLQGKAKVLAQNMMCATTSKASPGAALGQLAPEAALSSRSRVRPPQTPACLGQPAAWAALALTHRPDFSTQARPGGGSVHHHCSHGRGDKILARQLRRRHCYSRSHKTGAGGTRPSCCK